MRRHLDYLRLRDDGELELETDDGQRLSGEGVSKELLKDWDLDLEEHRRRSDLDARRSRSPKLVHKLMFSMPAGTPPDKVLTAVKNFAREEFGLKHRYAMVLHTDEPHPHVHMVVKAVSEQGVRLTHPEGNAARMAEGVRSTLCARWASPPTPRNARSEARLGSPKRDGIYRAEQRGESRHTRARAEAVAAELFKGNLRVETGKARLLDTRREVERGWWAVSDILVAEGRPDFASQIRQFSAQMPPPWTDREAIAQALRRHTREARTRDDPTVR